MPVTIGVDIGTTAVKAVAADDDGNVVASVRVDHEVAVPEPGVLEHHAATAWRDDVRRAATEVAEAAVALGHAVAAINVAAMVPSACAVDGSGVPISPGMLYGDRRVTGGDSAANPSESGELSRMVGWLAAHHPQAAGYWPAQAVASAALCGRGVIDPVLGYSASPLVGASGWDPDAIASIGVRLDQLPEIVPGNEAAGVCSGEWAGVLAGVPVGSGTIDAFGEQLVAGADHAGDVLLIMGATLIIWAAVSEWVEAPGLWTIPHTARGLTLVGGPSNAGGMFHNWAARLFRSAGESDVDSVGDAGVDLDDVPVFLPYLRGERTPLHDPYRRAEVHDLHVGHGPAAVWRGVHEASGFVVRRHLELAGLLAGGAGPDRSTRIVATGGGSRDEEWVQAIADVTGLPVDCVAVPEGAALGTAYLARVTAGLERHSGRAGSWARTGRRVDPDPAWTEATGPRFDRFQELTGPFGAAEEVLQT